VAGAHARRLAQLPLCDGRGCFRQDLFDALLRGRLALIASVGGRLFDDLESERWWVGFEGKLQPVGAGRGAMLDIEVEVLAVATQIEVGVAPSVQLRRSSERLAAALMRRALACVMDEGDGGVRVALQRAQIGQQWCDLTGDILIDCVQTHKRCLASIRGARLDGKPTDVAPLLLERLKSNIESASTKAIMGASASRIYA
jgi:hypothetical protein